MRLLQHYKNNKPNTDSGFTLIEMLVVAPILVLMIGVFIGSIVTMTGEVLASRSSSVMAFDIQDALNQINKDVMLSNGAFLATNDVTLTSPQGYNNDNTAFRNADATNGTMLILKAPATSTNPLDSKKSLIYLANQTKPCADPNVNLNASLMTNIIYFVKDNTLWRRVIMPSDYATSGCGTPWQLPSCAPGYTDSFCKAEDTKLVEGVSVSDFNINYYAPGSNTPDTIANSTSQSDGSRNTALQALNTVDVSITAKKTVSGHDLIQSSKIRAVNNLSLHTYKKISILAVGGGGGGGTYYGGGGGGGQFVYQKALNLQAGTYSVVVGGGGAGATSDNNRGGNGGNTTFSTIIANGGGGGGGGATNISGLNGANGGGGNAPGSGLNASTGKTAGYSGGTTSYGNGGGGGGGCGGTGQSYTVTSHGGDGGIGLSSQITLSTTWYCGGGGGGSESYAPYGAPGGSGVGGNGANRQWTVGLAGSPNTGGGGGGGGYPTVGGNGGSGIVIIRYLTGSISASVNGTVTTATLNGYTIHTFTGNGNFILS